MCAVGSGNSTRLLTLKLKCTPWAAKYLGVTLSNDLEWSKHIATMTNKANSKLSFLCCNLQGCPEELKHTAYLSLIHSFIEYGAMVWDSYKKYNSDKVERVLRGVARFVKSRYIRYSSVSDMLDELGVHLFLKGEKRLDLVCFTKILTFWHKCPSKASVLRRIRALEENTIRDLDRLVIQLAFAQDPSFAEFRSNFLLN